MARPPRIPVWLKWDQPVIYFLTFCVTKRQKVLANDEAFTALKEAIGRLTSWKIIAAVLMPDHVHLLLGPVEREAAVGNASGAIKRFVRQQLRAPWQWQPGSFDRLLRPMNRRKRNGNTSVRIRCGQGWWKNGRIGHIASASNCRAGASPAPFIYSFFRARLRAKAALASKSWKAERR